MPYGKWDPFQDLLLLHREIFGEGSEFDLAGESESAWTPPVDVFETRDNYVLKAELPGINPDDIKLEYLNKKLVLSGKREPLSAGAKKKYHQVERIYGPFKRTLWLPEGLCCEEIQALYEEGVLEITIPKKASTPPKNIVVRSED